MEALFAKIHKDQASQLEMLRHTKRAMDRSMASRDSSDAGAASMASLSFEILGELLDEIVLDVVSEAHRDVKTMRSICPVCKTKCRNYGMETLTMGLVRAGLDIFGQNPQSNSSQTYDCVHCQRSFPAQRYAPHLEKCLGLSGELVDVIQEIVAKTKKVAFNRRGSNRMGAGERAGSGSPFTPVSYSDDREASDSDKDLMEKKRKKNTPVINGYQSNGNSNGSGNSSSVNGSGGGDDYSTPGSVKSSSSSMKVKKQKQADSSDYPTKTQKSSLLAKASKGSSSTKLKGLGLHTPSGLSATPVGEISLGYLDDELLLANGRSLQNGAGGGGSTGNNSSSSSSSGGLNGHSNSSNGGGGSNGSSNGATPQQQQKLSSFNPKRASGGVSSSKRPPGSGSSKNGQVASSLYDRLKAIGSSKEESSDDGHDSRDDGDGDGGRDGGSIHSSSQLKRPVVIRIKKSSAFSGLGSDSLDTDFIDIDGDGDDDAMEILQTPKKKKS
ncbi:hypothetical protein BGZ99_005194 [Dissophora globulifera]|uniref:SAGA-associated factor 11 n=1 Tax=Dissophora globulifera TaxID=979702 RepID=A0A9P6UTQ1_9FUNG|nr:hypothetical protein BGZ99_005194 [Dissophora globulifera]